MEYLLKIVVFHSYVRGNEAANIGIQAARKYGGSHGFTSSHCDFRITIPIGSMYAIYGNIYHQYTPNVTIYGIHGSYGIGLPINETCDFESIVTCF